MFPATSFFSETGPAWFNADQGLASPGNRFPRSCFFTHAHETTTVVSPGQKVQEAAHSDTHGSQEGQEISLNFATVLYMR